MEHLIAPGIGFLGLASIVILAVVNFDIVAGSDALAINLLPLLLVVALVGGIGHAVHLRRNKPEVYAGLSNDLERFAVEPPDAVVPAPTVPSANQGAVGGHRRRRVVPGLERNGPPALAVTGSSPTGGRSRDRWRRPTG